MSKGHLNDRATMPDYKIRDDNFHAWMKHYQDAPSISPEGLPTSGGHGFIDQRRMSGPTAVSDALHARRDELERAVGPDKDRLQLLYRAETLYNLSPGSRSEVREAMSDLIAYDRAHGHPMANPHRDLDAEPYTPQEQAHWHRRDGRSLTTAEQERASGLDWNNPLAHQHKPAPMPEGTWWLHPANEPKRQEALRRIEREMEDARGVGAHRPVPHLGADAVRQRREITP